MHKQKGVVEIVLVLLLVVALGLAGYFYLQGGKSPLKPPALDPTVNECVERLRKEGKSGNEVLIAGEDYKPGDVLVWFKEGVTKEEATRIIESYGLTVATTWGGDKGGKGFSNIYMTANVQKGLEFTWVCKLHQNEKIEGASVNHLLMAL